MCSVFENTFFRLPLALLFVEVRVPYILLYVIVM